MIWTKHGKGSSASYAIGNPDNTVVQGPNMAIEGPNEAIERQYHYPQMDHVMMDATDDFFGSGRGDEDDVPCRQ